VDGTTDATAVSAPALAGIWVREIASVNGTLFVTASTLPTDFTALPPATPPDVNLWKIDTTAPGGAVRLTDFHGSGAGDLQVVGDKVLFQHTSFTGSVTSPSGGDLWISDGTTAGTQQVFAFTGGAHPDLSGAASADGDLYFEVYSYFAPTPPALWV